MTVARTEISDVRLPPDARVIPEWISPAEETALAGYLDAGEWSGELRRRVRHFGYRYDYRARIATPQSRIGPLPDMLQRLGRRMVEEGIFASLPDQVIANEYLPGQGISAHVDCEPCFGDVIVSLSLLSPCQMQFRRVETGEKRAVILRPRSLLVLEGAARHDWTHAIPARRSDRIDGVQVMRGRRVSLTFRTMRF
ncbi:alpha-ketoglutarate-dependent dioxygenase AlkB [Rhizobium glycinendophyticum]|uniref:Alpha-ketoglutarate-dependent dioxygenase AlkB n=1 Tax=Rhizobium glycinendophyticum TaxID=2589807 RepID=A0A504U5X6_9HYPH|nr:alpha-ketoglutarate-dependent dioxygenase AlkB [Rhizobium glycinendophyticum]TPP10424.1 alpha-ketoglutarate-dependent dioxygenase AlkB [Rhizobium glycinendophyticum]